MKTMTVSRRITSGFALLLLITTLLGGIAAWEMRTAATGATFLSAAVAPQAEVTSKLADASARTQLAVRTFGLTGAPKCFPIVFVTACGGSSASTSGVRRMRYETPTPNSTR